MTYYTAVQPVLLLRAMRVTTKAISRIGGWGRISGQPPADFYRSLLVDG